jgi:sugar fermentation stimulation protein A
MNSPESQNDPRFLTKRIGLFKEAPHSRSVTSTISALLKINSARNLSSASMGFACFFGYKTSMRFKSRLIRGTLIQRYKRFLADVRLENDEVVTAHCTNTGSMMGCKEPGSAVYISRSDKLQRKLAYTWEMIEIAGSWVGINTMHPNKLVAEAVESGVIKELRGYPTIRREVKVSAHTRLDLCLEGSSGNCFVEVKNVTLAVDGTAAFPDAVSERGTKHLKELIRLKRQGHRAALVFVIQRGDCETFRPADEIDSEYGRWLRKAVKAGVEALPYIARVAPKEIILSERIAIQL